METYPFTSPGEVNWRIDLNASPAPVQEEEANDAEADFKNWLKKRFELSPEQQDYLAGLDDALTDHWGQSIAFFIRHQLPIVLVKPEQSPEDKSAKLVLSEEELREDQAPRAEDSTGFEGTLTFTITY